MLPFVFAPFCSSAFGQDLGETSPNVFSPHQTHFYCVGFNEKPTEITWGISPEAHLGGRATSPEVCCRVTFGAFFLAQGYRLKEDLLFLCCSPLRK